MNLVDEEHVAFLKVGQQGSDIAGLLNRWTGSRSQLRAHLVRDDVCECRLAQTRWTSEQHVVECFATIARGLHVDTKILLALALADVFMDASWAQRQIELAIVVVGETVFHAR